MIDQFEKSANGNIVTLKNNDKTIHLIGTAHVSQASVDEVTAFIKENKPDKVCIELCKARFDTIRDKDRWKKMDIYQVIKNGKGFLLLTNLMISSFQHKIGKKLGVKPGAEMIAAIETAEAMGCEVVLIDRDIQITLKRTWKNISFFKKLNLMTALMGGLVVQEEIKEEDIEKLKSSDTLADAMESLGQEIPGLKESLIDERDHFMASHLTDLKGKNIVAIVGAGHVPGMQKYIGETIDRSILEVIPPPSKIFKVLKWVIPALIVGIITWSFMHNKQEGYLYIFIWSITHSIPAAIGVMLAGGRLFSILTAFLIAPITPIIPVLRISIIVGLVETIFRKPKVEDLEGIQDAFENVKSFYKNSVTRILLVAIFSSFGSVVGTFILFPYALTYHKEFLESLLNAILKMLHLN